MAVSSVSHHTEQDFLENGVWGRAGPFFLSEAGSVVRWTRRRSHEKTLRTVLRGKSRCQIPRFGAELASPKTRNTVTGRTKWGIREGGSNSVP